MLSEQAVPEQQVVRVERQVVPVVQVVQVERWVVQVQVVQVVQVVWISVQLSGLAWLQALEQQLLQRGSHRASSLEGVCLLVCFAFSEQQKSGTNQDRTRTPLSLSFRLSDRILQQLRVQRQCSCLLQSAMRTKKKLRQRKARSDLNYRFRIAP